MKKSNAFIWIMAILALIAVYMLGRYFWQFAENGWSNDPMEWGAFGSYMGAITGLLAFVGVLYSVHNANKKSAEAKEEAEKVRKEAAAEDKKIREEAKIESEKLRDEARAKDERDLFFKLIDSHQRTMDTIVAKDDTQENISTGLVGLNFYARETDNSMHTFLLLLQIGHYKNYEDWEEKTNVIKHGDNVFSDLRKSFMNAANKTYLYDSPTTERDFYSFIWRGAISVFKENYLIPVHKYLIKDELYSFRRYPELIYGRKNELEKYTILRKVALCFYKNYSSYLSYHFNNVCYITKMLDSFKCDKEFYMDYWKSKLSSNECLVFFFYLLSGKVAPEIVRLVLKYNLLDNIISSDNFLLEKGEKLKMLAIDSLNKLMCNTKGVVLLNIYY